MNAKAVFPDTFELVSVISVPPWWILRMAHNKWFYIYQTDVAVRCCKKILKTQSFSSACPRPQSAGHVPSTNP